MAKVVSKQEWISIKENPPVFHVNSDGIVCTDLCLFRCVIEKCVFLGYGVKTSGYGKSGEKVEIIKWLDRTGWRWDNVSHWAPIPNEEEVPF